MKRLFLGILVMFLVLISGVNAFTINTVPEQTWNEKYPWELSANLSTFVVGAAENETFTYSIKSQTDTDIVIGNVNTGLPTFTVADEDWTGSNNVVFTITGSVGGTVDTTTVKLTRNVPAYCSFEDYGGTKIKIGDIDFDDEKYKIGDTVTVTIEDVEALNEDLDDVEAQVYLYNVDEHTEIEDWDIDEKFDINEGKKGDFELEFKIPNSKDIGKTDNYRLVVYITGDIESGDQRCVQGSEDIKIKRETHDVIVSDVTLSPSIAKAGETIQLSVKVENIGTKDEEDVYVKLKEDLLKIDLESSKFDLDNYEDSDNTNTVRFTITIPEDAKLQDYSLEPVVYFDDGDETNGGKFATLKIESAVVVSKKALFEVTTSDTKIDATKGKTTSLHLIITSNEASDADATIELSTIGNWAEAILPQAVSLHNGENNIYLPLTLKEVTTGMHTATVTIKPVGTSTFAVKQATLNFEVTGEVKEVKEATTPTGLTTAVTGLKGSSMFWIIGDIVLVIIALFFIKAIFFGKKE